MEENLAARLLRQHPPEKNSVAKIRLKGSAKQYKSGAPGVSGRARLERSVRALVTQAYRFSRKAEGEDAAWASALVRTLQGVLGVPENTAK